MTDTTSISGVTGSTPRLEFGSRSIRTSYTWLSGTFGFPAAFSDPKMSAKSSGDSFLVRITRWNQVSGDSLLC